MRLFLLLLVVGSLRGQVIVNGGFENPAGAVNLSGAFLLPGWSGLGPNNGGNAGVMVAGQSPIAPAEGNQFFVFNGGNPSDRGWLEQSFATVPGATYRVEFSAGRIGGGQDLRLLAEVSGVGGVWGGGEFLAPAAAGFGVRGFSFVAAGDLACLRFTDTSGGNSISDLALDNVIVTLQAVPEPGAWVLLAVGLGVVLVAGRRAVA